MTVFLSTRIIDIFLNLNIIKLVYFEPRIILKLLITVKGVTLLEN